MGELECVCHLQESGTDPNCPRCLADIAGLSSQEEARELKACPVPWCGAPAYGPIKAYKREKWFVACRGLANHHTEPQDTPVAAVKQWNTRAIAAMGAPEAPADTANLYAKLLRREDFLDAPFHNVLVNPDGPEAVAALEAQSQRYLTRPTPDLGDVDELLKALELARNEIVGSLELLRGLRSARNIEWGEDGGSALNARIASCEATLVKTTDTIIALRAALDKKD
jgi:hypothetical protein